MISNFELSDFSNSQYKTFLFAFFFSYHRLFLHTKQLINILSFLFGSGEKLENLTVHFVSFLDKLLSTFFGFFCSRNIISMQIKWKFEWKWTANVLLDWESAHVWWVWMERQSEKAKREVHERDGDCERDGWFFAFAFGEWDGILWIAFYFKWNFLTIFGVFSCSFWQFSDTLWYLKQTHVKLSLLMTL